MHYSYFKTLLFISIGTLAFAGCASSDSQELTDNQSQNKSVGIYTCQIKQGSSLDRAPEGGMIAFINNIDNNRYVETVPEGAHIDWLPEHHNGNKHRIRVTLADGSREFYIRKVNTTCPPVPNECYLIPKGFEFSFYGDQNNETLEQILSKPNLTLYANETSLPGQVARLVQSRKNVEEVRTGMSYHWMKLESLYWASANNEQVQGFPDFWVTAPVFGNFIPQTCPEGYRK